ncbi:MAG: hypothetical protein DRN30_04255 [Thermoplasmata archaeon]|nr:DHH family phosphoesterase [Euryarchaeota archaeon]RLF65288.1 MAG: hypothetical protein DRN30_04255 [Thermoplasmata archaeon]
MENHIKSLMRAIERFSEHLNEMLSRVKRVLVIGHNDADGYSSMAIMSLLLEKKLEPEMLSWMSFDSPVELFRTLKNINVEKFDAAIVVDFGSEDEMRELFDIFKENVLIIDHHVSYPQEYKDFILNPRMLGIEADSFACSSTLAYSLARMVGVPPEKIYAPPIVGAIGDVQYDYEDSDEAIKALVGYNRYVLEELKDLGLVSEEIAPNIYGKYQQTMHDAINKYGLFSRLFSDIVPERYSTMSWYDLKKDDRMNIIAKILERVSEMGILSKEVVSELFIYDYIFPKEDIKYFREAKEFATLVNNLVRLNLGKKAKDLALSILKYNNLRKNKNIIKTLEGYLQQANRKKREYYRKAKDGAECLSLKGIKAFVYIDLTEKPMPPAITGSVAGFLMNLDKGLSELYVVGTYDQGRDLLKISVRVSSETFEAAIGDIIREIARDLGGEGGGHKFAGGCEFSGLMKKDTAKRKFYDVIYRIIEYYTS